MLWQDAVNRKKYAISGDYAFRKETGQALRHNLISDVRELPHKLPRIYRTLTR
jgi:hypothetical protein